MVLSCNTCIPCASEWTYFILLDRVFFSAESVKPNPFAFKPGASIAVARRGGTTASFDVLNKYFGISQMPNCRLYSY